MRQLFSSALFRRGLALIVCAFAGAAHAQHASDQWMSVSRLLAPSGGATDFTPHGTQPGLVYDIQAPELNCGACHWLASGDPASASTFRPYSTWAGSMMANSIRDPVFFAALDIANNDVPGVGDYCLRCHASRGWYNGHVVKPGFGPPNDPVKGAAACLINGSYDALDDINSEYDGVTCHYCHRLMPTGPNGEPGYFENADAWVDDVACANTGGGPPCRRGPYDYTDGASPPPHEWMYSAYHTQSDICGNCHNVSTPDTDTGPLKTLKLNDGTDTGHPFPIERTFAEWQQSQFSQAPQQTCQSCHMPESEDPDATVCSYRINNRTGNLPVHAFVGGNTWVPGIIKGEYGAGLDQGLYPRTPSYDQTIDWARQLLGTSAEVDTTIQNYTPPTSSDPGAMTLSVKVTNLSGHKLPTGYSEGRRMWVNLQVRDANGGLVFESGAYNQNTAELDQDVQARVYEVKQGIWNYHGTSTCDIQDSDGDPMFHFALNDCIAMDNRIPPLGFTPATASDPNGYDLRPVGANYPETTPGSGILVNYDTIPYNLSVPAGTVGPLTATARLYYQTSSNYYIKFLRDQAVENGFAGENDMCSGGPNRPFTVGPQGRTRGQFIYELWAGDRIFGAGFDDDQPLPQSSYGKSPPELVQVGAATTSLR